MITNEEDLGSDGQSVAGPPPLTVEHVCRVSILEPEKTWSLRGHVLWVKAGDYPEFAIPLDSLREVRLVFSPTRAQRNRYQCHLFSDHGQCAEIQNEHYKGVMDFEDRSTSYRELVSVLVKRTGAVNPFCRFATGASRQSWLLQTAFLAAMLALLLALLVTMWSAVGGMVILKLLIIAFYIPTAWAWIAKNKPARFAADEIPEALLPRLPEPETAGHEAVPGSGS